jgi:hypothetical protein
MVVKDVSWEMFEERFWERYMSEEFIERQLNEFNALRQSGRTIPEYEARCMELLEILKQLRGGGGESVVHKLKQFYAF